MAGVYPEPEDPFESVPERGFVRVVVVEVGYARYARVGVAVNEDLCCKSVICPFSLDIQMGIGS